MYQFSNNVSFRIQTEEQKNILNSVASDLQEQQSIVFDNAREFTLNLVAEYRRIQLENISLKSAINANADAHLHSETNAEPNAEVNLNSEVNTDTNSIVNADADLNTDSDTTEIKKQIISFLGYEETVTDAELLNDCLMIIHIPKLVNLSQFPSLVSLSICRNINRNPLKQKSLRFL